MKNILFVCTGNTCRSPMALAFFKASMPEAYSASSAGISAMEGEPASNHSVKAMQADWGIDLQSHRARSIRAEDIHQSFLILTMTAAQRDTLRAYFPAQAGKIYTLKDFSAVPKGPPDISDPYGGTLEIYRRCAFEIKQAIDGLILKLQTL